MHRVERRQRLFRAPPTATFDPGQVAVEDAPRARAARLIRGALHRGRPVIVRHARWSAMRWLLQDVRAELAAGDPVLDARLVDLSEGDAEDTWTRIPDLLGRVLGIGGGFRAMVPATSEGFRERTAMALRKGRARPRKVLLCVDADVVGYANLQSICDAWTAAVADMTPGTAPLLVLACQLGGQSLVLDGALSFFLPDPTEHEALQMLSELLGEADRRQLGRVVDVLGPVPAYLLAAARGGTARSRDAIAESIGPLHRELVRAVEVVSTDGATAGRLEALAAGPQPVDRELDWPLQRSGLVRLRSTRGLATAELRTPLIREILG
jgi:hypothetical protein